jgi:Uma2 family endonuclease
MTMAPETTSPSVDSPPTFRFTREQYYKLADAGFFRDKRVQLIEGIIYTMAPQGKPHYLTLNLVVRALTRIFPEQSYWVRSQGPLNLGLSSDPEPDVAVVAGEMRSLSDHPTSAILVVEVSDTTLSFDRKKKASLYAQAGIADYWIINLRDHCIEIRRDPVADPDAPFGFRYQSLTTLKPPESLTPLANPTAQIPIADLLP